MYAQICLGVGICMLRFVYVQVHVQVDLFIYKLMDVQNLRDVQVFYTLSQFKYVCMYISIVFKLLCSILMYKAKSNKDQQSIQYWCCLCVNTMLYLNKHINNYTSNIIIPDVGRQLLKINIFYNLLINELILIFNSKSQKMRIHVKPTNQPTNQPNQHSHLKT